MKIVFCIILSEFRLYSDGALIQLFLSQWAYVENLSDYEKQNWFYGPINQHSHSPLSIYIYIWVTNGMHADNQVLSFFTCVRPPYAPPATSCFINLSTHLPSPLSLFRFLYTFKFINTQYQYQYQFLVIIFLLYFFNLFIILMDMQIGYSTEYLITVYEYVYYIYRCSKIGQSLL